MAGTDGSLPHYLGHRTAYGAALRYLVTTHGATPQTLGGLQFSSPAWRMRARDAWIGWDDAIRQRHLLRVIANSRFLLLPWVRVPHVASHVLALSLRRVSIDWQACYGLRPWLAETLVDPQRFSGTCYRAANWLEVGFTTGRGRNDRDHDHHGAAPKRVFLYPLRLDARSALAATP
ncbi:MAG: Druantia anti-phage system protein DruA [Rhodanobacteraceae bacterium]